MHVIPNASHGRHDLTEEDVLSMHQMHLEFPGEETEDFDDHAHRVNFHRGGCMQLSLFLFACNMQTRHQTCLAG